MEERRFRLGVREENLRIFTFDELSKEAQARAIKDFRGDPELTWDQSDSEQLTEMFEQDLVDHYRLGAMKVHWSLSSCQGDGVCFEGHVDLQDFLKAERKIGAFRELLGRASAKITHEGRYCHWNSMEVEVDSDIREEDLLSRRQQAVLEEWQHAVSQRFSEIRAAEAERNRPLQEWNRGAEAWKRARERLRKQDWRPGLPSSPEPRPQPADVVVPEMLAVPPEINALNAEMKSRYDAFEAKLEEFRTYLDERVKEISRELEKTGYAEIEYHSGEEYARERLENTDWEYLEDGERYDG